MEEKRSEYCSECGYCASYPPKIIPEEVLIKEIVQRVVAEKAGVSIPISVSARHLHISQEDLETLFGPGYKLELLRNLMQPGEFASTAQVTLVSAKMKSISGVRILGPVRKFTQVELARTDAVHLGISLPLRESGDLRDAQVLTIIGPKGAVTKPCAIKAKRHIHMSPKDAEMFGVKDKEIVKVKVLGEEGGIFSGVVVRVSEKFVLEMHIDTDEANAFGIACGAKGILIREGG